MRHRLSGLFCVAIACVLAWLVFAEHAPIARAIIGAPLLGATGLWLIVFGYPVRKGPGDAEPIAPLWWRLGLVGFVLVATLGTCAALR